MKLMVERLCRAIQETDGSDTVVIGIILPLFSSANHM